MKNRFNFTTFEDELKSWEKMKADPTVSLTSVERAETSMLGGLQTEVYLQQSGVWRWTQFYDGSSD